MNRGCVTGNGGPRDREPTHAGPGDTPTPPLAYGLHYSTAGAPPPSTVGPGGPYMSPYPTAPGGYPGPSGPPSTGPPDQFGTNYGYYSQPSPNEEGNSYPSYPNAPGGSPGGGPPPRDLSYYGFNNGFGSSESPAGGGGGAGGSGGNGSGNGTAFYPQQQQQPENNNKLSDTPNSYGDTIKKSPGESHLGPGGDPDENDSKSELKVESTDPNNSDNMNNSDNPRSQQSPLQGQNSPQLIQGGIMQGQQGHKRSPASHESSEFEHHHGFGGGEAGNLGQNLPPGASEEYMRQMAAMQQQQNHNEGKIA